MSIRNEADWLGMRKVGHAVSETLRAMQQFAQPGISTLELDRFGAHLLSACGARSAPRETYGFPGYTCISVNHEFCHGIPSAGRLLAEGDLVNIDVSAELNGYWADNGASFVVGRDLFGHQQLVNASNEILNVALSSVKSGQRIADLGGKIESEAKKRGFKVIRNLTGHGTGGSLHEYPHEIPNFKDRYNRLRFGNNSVVAIETFISTASNYAITGQDGWTMVGDRGGFMAQHEHTLVVTPKGAVVLT